MNKLSRFQRGSRYMVALGILLGLLASGPGGGYPVQAQQPVRIIWLHHSCGQNLINQGGVRQGLTSLGYEFYDHGYNEEGLRLADGSYAGTNYDIPGDNTDPDGLAELFGQPLHDPPDNAFSHLMQYDVIAFKSCFPTSNIGSDEQLAEYQAYYRAIRDRIAQHPTKLFITVTQPPQVPGASDAQEASRARALANWLASDAYLAGLPNLVTFDFFGYLAGDDNMLRPEYRMDDYDAHPNERANRDLGPRFVSFVDQAIRSYGVSPAPPAEVVPQPAAPTEPPPPSPEPQVEAAAPSLPGNVVDSFELGDRGWAPDHDETGSTVACGLDSGMAYEGSVALRAEYAIVPGGWGGCTISLEPFQDWSAGDGLSLWVRSDGADQRVGLMVFAGDPMGATPFETFFETTPEMAGDWVQLVFPWTDLRLAEWADSGMLSELDPTRIVGFGFGLGLDEAQPDGVLWVDDIRLTTGQTEPAAVALEPAPLEEPTSPAATEPAPSAVEPVSITAEHVANMATAPSAEATTAATEPVARAEAMATAEITILSEPAAPTQERSSRGICPSALLFPLGTAALLCIRWRS
jgi:hypothetical protein